MSPPAHAGTWSFAATSWSYTHTLNGATYGTLQPRNYGSQIFAAGGQDNASTTAVASENLTVAATCNPDPNVAGDTAPPSTVVATQSYAHSDGIVNHVMTPGRDADDGFSDPIDSTGTSKGIHYRVETGSTFQETLTLFASYTNPSGVAEAVVGGVSVSIVNGGWAGPYYFHNGSKTTLGGTGGGVGVVSTPWKDNTAGSTPTTQDNADTANGFLFQESVGPELHNGGNITPVWYWTGPDLGMPPPPFEIEVSAEAYANDDANSYDHADVDDGLEDGPTEIPGGNISQGSKFYNVTVQSDEAAPEEGNGYWAIGPTITLKADIDAPVNESAPYSLLSSVSISAVITSGLNN